jgi:hypothetical protein
MPSEFRIVRIAIVLPLLIIAMVAVGVGLGLATRDPEWLKRSGAAIAAVAAGAILLQIRVELKIEQRRRNLEKETGRAEEVDRSSPMGALEARLTVGRIERMNAELTTTRLKVAGFVVACAMIGELLHGFGDLVMCSVFAVCH